jgi:4-hydroxy-tetrahydrodipicolinate synthase
VNPDLTAAKVIVPMVSPFNADHTIDEVAVARLCEKFITAGVSVFVFGTTGEGDSMSPGQRDTLLKLVIREVKSRVKIYAGLTGNSLSASIENAEKYKDMGADYLVGKIPSYYPMDENQMLGYIEKLADSVKLPLFIYNIPATTHHSIPLSIIDKLSFHPNIFGLKDSERNPERLKESIRLWGKRKDFDFLIGWAVMSAYRLLKGANGIVPGSGNLYPELYVQIINCVREGIEEKAQQYQEITDRISALYQKGRNLSQSIPALKTLMEMKGLCSREVLLPMCTMTSKEKNAFISDIKSELAKLNL